MKISGRSGHCCQRYRRISVGLTFAIINQYRFRIWTTCISRRVCHVRLDYVLFAFSSLLTYLLIYAYIYDVSSQSVWPVVLSDSRFESIRFYLFAASLRIHSSRKLGSFISLVHPSQMDLTVFCSFIFFEKMTAEYCQRNRASCANRKVSNICD